MNKKCIHEPRTQKTNIIQNNTNPKIYHRTTRILAAGRFLLSLEFYVLEIVQSDE